MTSAGTPPRSSERPPDALCAVLKGSMLGGLCVSAEASAGPEAIGENPQDTFEHGEAGFQCAPWHDTASGPSAGRFPGHDT